MAALVLLVARRLLRRHQVAVWFAQLAIHIHCSRGTAAVDLDPRDGDKSLHPLLGRLLLRFCDSRSVSARHADTDGNL